MHQTQRIQDVLGCSISGATAAGLEAYEKAMAAFQSWRSGADLQLALALQKAPNFVMAHARLISRRRAPLFARKCGYALPGRMR